MLFIDEIHRLNPAVEEILYPAMEDYQLDHHRRGAGRALGEDRPGKFTLMAPPRARACSPRAARPLRHPGAVEFLHPRGADHDRVTRGAGVLKITVGPDGASEIARRSRGTPRIAGRLAATRARLCCRGRRHAWLPPRWPIARSGSSRSTAKGRRTDHRYLSCIANNYNGGPVGIETLSAALSEPRDALEEIVEPFLLQQGFIGRTPRGRVLTLRAYKHLGLTGPARAATPQIGLFDESVDDAADGKAGTG